MARSGCCCPGQPRSATVAFFTGFSSAQAGPAGWRTAPHSGSGPWRVPGWPSPLPRCPARGWVLRPCPQAYWWRRSQPGLWQRVRCASCSAPTRRELEATVGSRASTIRWRSPRSSASPFIRCSPSSWGVHPRRSSRWPFFRWYTRSTSCSARWDFPFRKQPSRCWGGAVSTRAHWHASVRDWRSPHPEVWRWSHLRPWRGCGSKPFPGSRRISPRWHGCRPASWCCYLHCR